MKTLLLPLLAAFGAEVPPTPVAQPPRVAIIDSGVARTPELAPLVSAEYDMAGSNRPAFQPRYDHGTMVATILARAANRNVDIISIRIDDPSGCPEGANPPCQPSARPIAAAIRRATELNVDAINISLALSRDPEITQAIREAGEKGIRVVLAAGNDGFAHPGNLPQARAAYPNAVLVGAVDSTGQVWSGTNRPDANPDGYLYHWQLGVQVPTTAADGRPMIATGTSFAAPIETARQLAARTSASL